MHRIGKRVRFLGYKDEFRGLDIPIGTVGTVVAHETEDVGASPADPFHLVWFKGLGKEGMWSEELEPA